MDLIRQHPNVALAVAGGLLVIVVDNFRKKSRVSLKLSGPPSPNFLFGVIPYLFKSVDERPIFERWREEYGPVFEIPVLFGKRAVVLMDPKAITTFFTRDTTVYRQRGKVREFMRRSVSVHPLYIYLLY
jgi:hypothetical protein